MLSNFTKISQIVHGTAMIRTRFFSPSFFFFTKSLYFTITSIFTFFLQSDGNNDNEPIFRTYINVISIASPTRREKRGVWFFKGIFQDVEEVTGEHASERREL